MPRTTTIRYWMIASITALGLPSLSLADAPASAPQNGSGYSADRLNVDLNLKPGALDIKSRQISVQGGYLQNNRGQAGGTLQIDAEKKLLINSSPEYNGSMGFMINPGVHARLDVFAGKDEKKQVKTSIEISGFAVFRGHQTTATKETSLTEKELQPLLQTATEASFDRWTSCARESEYYQERLGCLQGLPEDRKTWTDEQKADFEQRQIPLYSVTTKPSTSGEVILLQATGVYEKSPLIKAESVAGRIRGLSFNGQTSFRVGNQVQVDLCAGISEGLSIGQHQVGETKGIVANELQLSACAGLQIAKLGRVGYDVDFRHKYVAGGAGSRDGSVLSAAQSLSLSKIANSAVKAAWTHEIERSQDQGTERKAGGVTTNLFTVGAAF